MHSDLQKRPIKLMINGSKRPRFPGIRRARIWFEMTYGDSVYTISSGSNRCGLRRKMVDHPSTMFTSVTMEPSMENREPDSPPPEYEEVEQVSTLGNLIDVCLDIWGEIPWDLTRPGFVCPLRCLMWKNPTCRPWMRPWRCRWWSTRPMNSPRNWRKRSCAEKMRRRETHSPGPRGVVGTDRGFPVWLVLPSFWITVMHVAIDYKKLLWFGYILIHSIDANASVFYVN